MYPSNVSNCPHANGWYVDLTLLVYRTPSDHHMARGGNDGPPVELVVYPGALEDH